MVDFNFDLKSLFPQRIIKVRSDLLPNTFNGNRYQVAETKTKVCQIINDLGELSAIAQKLNKPITTYQKLINKDDQTIYLLADPYVQPRGVAVGFLKVGHKDLFVYDEKGQMRQIPSSPCILDFYIHEKYQRAGLGKQLFDTMLNEQKWNPVKCSIDRPSEKMIAFMKKHYGLERVIPQSNHYVLFEGYFNNNPTTTMSVSPLPPSSSSSSYPTSINNVQNMQPWGYEYVARNVVDLPNYHHHDLTQTATATTTPPKMAMVKRCEIHCPAHYSMAELMRK